MPSSKAICAAAGASGRNGGCLLTGSTKFFTLSGLFGEAEAVRLVQALEKVADHIGDFCRKHPTRSMPSSVGTAHSTTPPPKRSWGECWMNLKRRGITSYHALPDAEVQQRSGSARNLSGVFAPIAATRPPMQAGARITPCGDRNGYPDL